MSRRAKDRLRGALDWAVSKGVQPCRGPVFDWTTGAPGHCDATGAVLLLLDRRLEPGWLHVVCGHLDVDGFWLWRFWRGWDGGRQVENWDEDSKTWIADDVSLFGKRLAAEYVK